MEKCVNIEEKLIKIDTKEQWMHCYEGGALLKTYPISSAKNGLGEQWGSECTPRGWHRVHDVVGHEHEINSVFISRVWTGELYSDDLAKQFPNRDWILTRIIQLDGLEPGFNQGGQLDTLRRCVYIHGTPDSTPLRIPGSHGCIRMCNADIIMLASWVKPDTRVYIE